MASRALGLIEVRGRLGAVVAADAAVKAANVSLLNIEAIKAGLNTVQLVGDVSAVKSAVDAAVDAVKTTPYYLTSHVIPRLDEQTDSLFQQSHFSVTAKEVETPVLLKKQGDLTGESSGRYSYDDLAAMKVVELRSLAYRQEDISLTKKEIKFANKRQLIEALLILAGKERK